MGATLGVSISGDTIRMAVSGVHPAVVAGGSRAVTDPEYRGAPSKLDIDDLVEAAPGATPEERTASTIKAVIEEELGAGIPISLVMVAYQDEDQAKRLSFALDARGVRNCHLVPTRIAVMRALTATRQLRNVRTLTICHIDPWWFTADEVIVPDGAPLAEQFEVATEILADNDVDALSGVAYVVGEVMTESGVEPDLVVLVGEGTGEELSAEDVERELMLPVVIPAEPEMLTARGAALLQPVSIRRTTAQRAAAAPKTPEKPPEPPDSNEPPTAPLHANRGRPTWLTPAAAAAAIVLVCGIAAVIGMGTSGVFTTDNAAQSSPMTTTQAAPPPPPPPPAPTTTTQAPLPPRTTQAPAPTYVPPPVRPQTQPPAQPETQAPPPPPVTQEQPQAPTEQEQQAPTQQEPQQAPAPVIPPVIQVPGLPPIQLPRIPGL